VYLSATVFTQDEPIAAN